MYSTTNKTFQARVSRNKKKALLEAEIRRLEAHSMEVAREDSEREGLEIQDKDKWWFSVELEVDETLANWRKLPDGAGSLEAWKKLVDIDWDWELSQNERRS